MVIIKKEVFDIYCDLCRDIITTYEHEDFGSDVKKCDICGKHFCEDCGTTFGLSISGEIGRYNTMAIRRNTILKLCKKCSDQFGHKIPDFYLECTPKLKEYIEKNLDN